MRVLFASWEDRGWHTTSLPQPSDVTETASLPQAETIDSALVPQVRTPPPDRSLEVQLPMVSFPPFHQGHGEEAKGKAAHTSKAPPKPANEEERLAAIRALEIVDTEPEERFDDLTRLVSSTFGVPICHVTLLEAERVWYKSEIGLGVREVPRYACRGSAPSARNQADDWGNTCRDLSGCTWAALEPTNLPLIIENGEEDERMKHNPLVSLQPAGRSSASTPWP